MLFTLVTKGKLDIDTAAAVSYTHLVVYKRQEFVSTLYSRKNIRVRDRATLVNLLIGLNGYTAVSYTHL